MTDVTLADFLLARLAEDEAAARAAAVFEGGECWWVRDYEHEGIGVLTFEPTLSTGLLTDTTEHIARHDPARVLAECEAKRRIVARQPRLSAPDDVRDVWWDLVALLALPYASHPDYDESWRP